MVVVGVVMVVRYRKMANMVMAEDQLWLGGAAAETENYRWAEY